MRPSVPGRSWFTSGARAGKDAPAGANIQAIRKRFQDGPKRSEYRPFSQRHRRFTGNFWIQFIAGQGLQRPLGRRSWDRSASMRYS
jgi:hypothetical protein